MRSRAARIVSRLLPFVSALVATVLAIFSAAGYERVKSYMDSLSFDGDAFTFSPSLFSTLVMSARLTAGVLLVAAVALVKFRPHVERGFDTLFAGTLDYLRLAASDAGRTMREETTAHRAAVLAIIVLGIVLRVRVLWQPINYDEAFTYIVYANRPWLIAWANYSEPNNHLLHTLLVHVSISVFGNAVWALRVPALIAGCLAMPLAYAVTRRMTGRNEALIVIALTATSQMLIAFSVCARGYTMLLDLFLLALLFGHEIISRRSSQPWPLFVVSCALGFFTIPVFLYPYLSMLTWLFLAGRRDPDNAALRVPVLMRSALWTIALVIICYAPALVTSRLQAGINFSQGTVSMLTFITTLWRPLKGTWLDLMRGLPTALTAALAASAVLGAVRLWRTASGAILLLPIVLWPALTVPLQRTLAPARVWVYMLPVFFVCAAAGAMRAVAWIAARVPRSSPALAGATTGAMAFAISLNAVTHLPARYTEWNHAYEIFAHTDLDEVAGYLKTTLAERDALIAGHLLDFPLEYHMRRHGLPIAFLRRPPIKPERILLLANESVRLPVARVLAANGLDPERMKPRLVRRFTYSSLYEVQPQRGEQ